MQIALRTNSNVETYAGRPLEGACDCQTLLNTFSFVSHGERGIRLLFITDSDEH